MYDPSVVVLQDKREWDAGKGNKLAKLGEAYSNVRVLRDREDIFKLTVLKDAHQRPTYHRKSADEIGCHAWITYYHPTIVEKVAPYVRKEHLIRTYHTIDPWKVPFYSPNMPSEDNPRRLCILSGAIDPYVYPMRYTILTQRRELEFRCARVDAMAHPGYHNQGSNTVSYLKRLAQYQVAICTSSVYGYSLRKIIEATACGCRVITDLPVDDPLPYIDGNLHRIDLSPGATFVDRLARLIRELSATYNPVIQEGYAEAAKSFYSYNSQGTLLSKAIDRLRSNYN